MHFESAASVQCVMSNANAFAGTEDKPISTCAEIVTAPERGAAHDDALTCLAHFVIDFLKLHATRPICVRTARCVSVSNGRRDRLVVLNQKP